jgi:ABC-type multidrug transport system ATPase subunit
MTGALEVRAIEVKASGKVILSGIDLTLRAGELCGLIGPSGSGKSTFMKVLLGLRSPSAGKVSLGGAEAGAGSTVGYVPQDDALHTSLTVADSLAFAAELRLPELSEAERRARVAEVATQVGLEERLDVRVGRLSGGQRKRVSVAMELLTRPAVLILDEPTSGLDPGLEGKLMDLFAELAHSGRIVLVATHSMESLGRCDSLLVLVGGRLAYFGAPADAPAHFGSPGHAGIFGQLPARSAAGWASHWSSSPLRSAFTRRGTRALATQAAAGGLVASERSRPQSTVLSLRYLACLAGDWPTVALLLAQAPFIGWLCTVVWGSVETDTPSLRFVLCLSAVWFGCINACREIVKERAIVERERFFGLSMLAYVRSRFVVLAGLSLVQVVLLLGAVEWHIALHGPFLLQAMALWGVSVCGVGLGLLVSSLSSAQERAVGAVPLLILPQILFSEIAVPREAFGTTVKTVEWFMPVRWAYRVFAETAASEPRWLVVAGDLLVLPVYAAVLFLLIVVALQRRREI